VKLGLRNASLAVSLALAFTSSSARNARAESAGPAASRPLVIFADRDDDDDDGIPDGHEARLSKASSVDVEALPVAPKRVAALEKGCLRWVVGEQPWLGGGKAPRNLGLQGTCPGRFAIEVGDEARSIDVLEVFAVDGRGVRVDLATSHAAISRRLPTELYSDAPEPEEDPDALRWVVVGPDGALPDKVSVQSLRPDGRLLDALEVVEFAPAPCPDGTAPELSCRRTPLIRATGDRIDRTHPESSARSLRAEVGGRLVVSVAGRKAAGIRVGGPRATSVGQIGRLRGRVSFHIMRLAPGGMPAIGGDDGGALGMARDELDTASGLWGQCGIHFGNPSEQPMAVHDPPPPHLLAIGCDLGLPASGGEIRFAVEGRRVRVETAARQSPIEVAERVARSLNGLGFVATPSVNARVAPAAFPTVDVLVRKRDGSLASLKPDGSAPLSSDATLGACIGQVNLADGLTHFSDSDAASGTLEERTLIKAYQDADPTTIDIFIVPAFGGAGRIGESFVDSERASIQNVVILDRAGIRAGARSFALAHELGHILLDMPGHPDDFGVDRPSALMDADAADSSIFGPRRLSVAECERAFLQSGPSAPLPLLADWPLFSRSPAPSRPEPKPAAVRRRAVR
jgi:hypothetical protein